MHITLTLEDGSVHEFVEAVAPEAAPEAPAEAAPEAETPAEPTA